MDQTFFEVLKEYGIVGILLAYFLWKDSKVFDIFRKTMQEIVVELKEMRKEQDELQADMQQIKNKIDKQ